MQEIHKTQGSRKVEIPISEKYMLTINEAAAYFSIGVKKLRRMAEDNEGKFAITNWAADTLLSGKNLKNILIL